MARAQDRSSAVSDQRSWPIAVEYTTRHIVWAEAETAEKAADWVRGAPWEWTSNEDIANAGVAVEVADKWDHQFHLYDTWNGIGADHGPWAADRPQFYGSKPKVEAAP